MKKLLGYALLSSPFVAMFIFASIRGGVLLATIPFIIAAVIVAVIWAGLSLINGDW